MNEHEQTLWMQAYLGAPPPPDYFHTYEENATQPKRPDPQLKQAAIKQLADISGGMLSIENELDDWERVAGDNPDIIITRWESRRIGGRRIGDLYSGIDKLTEYATAVRDYRAAALNGKSNFEIGRAFYWREHFAAKAIEAMRRTMERKWPDAGKMDASKLELRDVINR